MHNMAEDKANENENENENDSNAPDREVYSAINSEFIEYDHDDTGKGLIGPMFGNLLFSIEEFVGAVATSDELAFKKEGSKLKMLTLGRYFRLMPGFMAQKQGRWTYSPRVERFFKAVESLPPLIFRSPDVITDAGMEGEVFNQFIHVLRADCQSDEFKEKLRQQGFRTNRRYRNLVAYVDRLFSLYSRLLVVRLDLHYKGDGEPITLERVQRDFATLVNNRRHNSIFKHQVGYIRRLEFGALRDHHHFHVVFFFDGANVRKEEFLADEIGRYWVKVTGGRGWYFNCNRDKVHRYRRVGIGMISHADVAMRANLLLALKYLVKKEQLLWVRPQQKVRAIECGRLTGRTHSGKGRPRAQADNSIG